MREIKTGNHTAPLQRDAVFVVDNDDIVRADVTRWLATLPCTVVSCRSLDELLTSPRLPQAACLLCEIRPIGIVGPELLQTLFHHGLTVPTILLAGDADIPTAVRMMREGAADLLEKPVVGRLLVARVRELIV